jgi:hypothetical protein
MVADRLELARVFKISTKSPQAKQTYVSRVSRNDGTTIDFRFWPQVNGRESA